VPALESLIVMGVNIRSDLSGHNPRFKIGVFDKAEAGEPLDDGAVPVNVEGYLYAKDFADEVDDLRAEKEDLGFSYEASAALEDDVNASVPTAVATSLVFTGATILYKKKAAYTKTSLAAEGDEQVNEEELKKALEAMGLGNLEEVISMFKDVQKAMSEKGVYTSMSMYLSAGAEAIEKVDELTKKVEGLEGALTASSEKVASLEGELALAKEALTAQAESLKASADVNLDGYVKSEQFDELKASYEALKAKVEADAATLKAEAEAKEAYARRSSAGLQLMAKYSIEPKDDLQAEIEDIGKRADIDTVEKMTLIMEAQARHKKQAQ
jgi:hypothetical protein